jgi:hypothetical protein
MIVSSSKLYVKYFSWALLTNVKFTIKGPAISGIDRKYWPFHSPLDQYGMEEFSSVNQILPRDQMAIQTSDLIPTKFYSREEGICGVIKALP